MENEIFFESLFSCVNPISGKIMVHKLWSKMLSSNQIARFFDHQCIQKESIYILDFCMDIFIAER